MSTKSISDVLFNKTRRALLLLLYSRPGESFYLRQILRAVDAGHGAVQRELKELAYAGIVSRIEEGNRVYYQANPASPIFRELKSIINPVVPNKTSATASRRFDVSESQLAEFCSKHHIKKLALFGSVLRDEFRPDSDIDVLVEFEPGHVPGFAIVDIERELSRMVGRKVDLRTPHDLSRYFRDQVVKEAEVRYSAA